MKTTKPLIAFLLLFTLTSCVFTSTYTNREADKQEAEKVTNSFFELIKAKNYEAAYPLFSDDFFSVTPKPKLKEMFVTIQDKLGDLTSTNLDQWQTKVVKGTDPSSEYDLLYQNQHAKFKSAEEFKLTKNWDGKIRILYYHVTSPGF